MMRYLSLCLLIFLTFTSVSFASNFNADTLGTIPILHEGRVKPLDTVARLTLKSIYGRERVDGISASAWMAEILFDPIGSTEQKIFRIENPEVRHLLSLIERKRPLYSFAEISKGLGATLPRVQTILETDKKDRTKVELDLLILHETAITYTQFLRSLSLILPLNINVPDSMKNDIQVNQDGSVSFMALKRYEQKILNKTKEIIARKGEDISNYTNDETQIVTLSYQLSLLQDSATRNELLRIIPSIWSKDVDAREWYSPWGLYQLGKASPLSVPLMDDLRGMAKAYVNEDQHAFDQSVFEFRATVFEQADIQSSFKFDLEVFKGQFEIQTIGFILYLLAFIGSLAMLCFGAALPAILKQIPFWCLSIGVYIHGFEILSRIYILARPPVSTLYESVIFVSFVSVVISLFLEKKYRDGLFLFLASLVAVGLGILSNTLNQNSDSMVMLSAVLNTQFWLATHVIIITLGYAWCVLVAILAHIILWGIGFKKITHEKISELTKSLHALTLMALLLTAIGTILGGIWADQSWGRFWGWDPKENGALLIVLWLIWVLHAKLSGDLNRILMLAALSFTSVIVALAWIGVNLLGVGLHSYGFTEGLFWGLGIFVAFEIILITYLSLRSNQQEKRFHA